MISYVATVSALLSQAVLGGTKVCVKCFAPLSTAVALKIPLTVYAVAADSQFMAAVWEEAGILPTDPGKHCRCLATLCWCSS